MTEQTEQAEAVEAEAVEQTGKSKGKGKGKAKAAPAGEFEHVVTFQHEPEDDFDHEPNKAAAILAAQQRGLIPTGDVVVSGARGVLGGNEVTYTVALAD